MVPKIMLREDFKVERKSGKTSDIYDETTGLTKKRDSVFFDAKGSIQPVSGFEILQVAEGDRTKRIFNIFTAFELKPDDIVHHKDDRYETRFVECWNDIKKFSYFKARVELIDVERD